MNSRILERLVIRACKGCSCTLFQSTRTFSGLSQRNVVLNTRQLLVKKTYDKYNVCMHIASSEHKNAGLNNPEGLTENISTLKVKKRPLRKRKLPLEAKEDPDSGYWTAKALATAEAYNLEGLICGLQTQQLYEPDSIQSPTKSLLDVVRAVAKYDVGTEPREIFFFREGTVVMWNVNELEAGNLLQFLRQYEENSYASDLVEAESELMRYTYTEQGKESHLRHGDIMLSPEATILDKYTFSNAMAQSVKLGMWEVALEHYIDSVGYVTADLKTGRKLRMSQALVLRKQGELFALRHMINLSSDLLDTPDFYWERDDLESLYHRTCAYFDIAKRTRVMNEKLNHCLELIGILSTHLSDRHHIRLEWMIIVLIMVEVAFEVLHYIDRYFA